MGERKKSYQQLRSHRWFGTEGLRSFGHRSRAMQMGLDVEDWSGRPSIAIINTWSDINPCHVHFKDRVEHIKRGILQAGGLPLELPALSLSENFVKPTTMLYRNFLAMECEELLRSHPVDGAVLMGGCDKTTPGLLLGAISMDIPAIFFPAGPMLRGNWKGEPLGSGSDGWKYWDELRAGNITEDDWRQVEHGIARSHGHCMTMGTASTMTSIAETLGFVLPGGASIPAPDANHVRLASATGRRIVDMVWEDLKPQDILTRSSFVNAITAAMAMGCSTNAIIHVVAMARRAGFDIGLDDFDALGRVTPVVANIRPNGDRYLMEDFYYAGGLKGMLKRIESRLDTGCMTVSGHSLGENLADAEVHDDDVIRPIDNPVYETGALAVLKGNLAPRGCVMKVSALDQRFLAHSGPALVFDDYAALKAAVDDEDLEVTADHVLVLRNAGPQGGPGMPEWGMLPIPKKLLKQGVRDMLRVSDARMSGTSYGACVLHVAPESYVGGPLALVENGDIITVDVERRLIRMEVDDDELARRRDAWSPPPSRYERGYGYMFSRHIAQADEGCDLDYLTTGFGAAVDEPAIYSIPFRAHPGAITMSSPLTLENRVLLATVSTATLTTALFKRGLKNTFIQDVHPINTSAASMVGEAYTLRYIPSREDLDTIDVFQDPEHPQRKAVEECPPGYVMVIDSRKDARAASAGSILVSRMMKRGCGGIVTDGGFRDAPTIAGLSFPAYHQRPAAPTNLTLHRAVDIDVPIGCGDVPVFPGDIMVGDGEGVVVIPAHLANEVTEEAVEMTAYEDFVTEEVLNGASIIGLYPATREESRERFAAWKKRHHR